jgi:hypothetical protein
MWGPYYGYVQLELMKTKMTIDTTPPKSVSSGVSSNESK